MPRYRKKRPNPRRERVAFQIVFGVILAAVAFVGLLVYIALLEFGIILP